MRRELDPQLEATVREQLTRLIDAIETTPPEAVDMNMIVDIPGPSRLDQARARAAARRRRTLILASTAVAAAAAAVLAFVVVPGDSRSDVVSGGGDRTTTTTTEATSTTATTVPDTTVTPAPADTGCTSGVASDGLVASGDMAGGGRWEYRVSGQLPDVEAVVLVDGTPVDGQYTAAVGQDQPLGGGQLRQGRVEVGRYRVDTVERETVEDVAVPAATATVQAYVWDGSQRSQVELCPRLIPGVADVKYAATYVPFGSELMAVIALDADGRAVAHSENVSIPDQGGPEAMSEVAGGELGSSRWSFQVGGDAELLAVKLDLPGPVDDGGGGAVRSRPDLLEDTWYASSVWDGSAGRYFLWGYTRADVTEVVMTMFDGSVHRIPTVATGLPGVDGRVFAGEFPTPAGPSVQLIEGHGAGGRVLVQQLEPENGSIGNGMAEQANVRLPMQDVG
jgi:hypothetical protein